MKNRKTILIIIIIIAIIAIVGYVITDTFYPYHADSTAINIMQNPNDNVTVREIDNGVLLDGPGNDTSIIFYPGVGVDIEAYAPIFTSLSQKGIDVFLVRMPLNFAAFDAEAADRIINNYNYSHWYMCGHSFGGVIASSYCAKHPENIEGLILFAAYPAKNLKHTNISVLSIYGSNDGVLNLKTYHENLKSMITNYTEVVIVGGNHANFGSYGIQEKDNNSTITPEQQWNETVINIIKFINYNRGKT